MTDADLSRALALLQLAPSDILPLRQARTEAEAATALAALKEKAKRCYKRAAAVLHPDATGGDPAKAEDFKLVSAFMREVAGMQPPEPRKSRYGTRRVVVKFRVTAQGKRAEYVDL